MNIVIQLKDIQYMYLCSYLGIFIGN